jgi:lysyl-tRNA synthetase class 1
MINLAKVAPPRNEIEFMKAKLEDYKYLKETRKGIEERIQKTLNWVNEVEDYEHEPIEISDIQKKVIQTIIINLDKSVNEKEFQATIFNASKSHNLTPREIFPIIYQILIGQTRGPRFGPYVSLVGKDSVIKELQSALKD